MHIRVMLVNNKAKTGTDRTCNAFKKQVMTVKLGPTFNASVDLARLDVVRCKEIVVRMRCDDEGLEVA